MTRPKSTGDRMAWGFMRAIIPYGTISEKPTFLSRTGLNLLATPGGAAGGYGLASIDRAVRCTVIG